MVSMRLRYCPAKIVSALPSTRRQTMVTFPLSTVGQPLSDSSAIL